MGMWGGKDGRWHQYMPVQGLRLVVAYALSRACRLHKQGMQAHEQGALLHRGEHSHNSVGLHFTPSPLKCYRGATAWRDPSSGAGGLLHAQGLCTLGRVLGVCGTVPGLCKRCRVEVGRVPGVHNQEGTLPRIHSP